MSATCWLSKEECVDWVSVPLTSRVRPVCLEDFVVGRVLGHKIDVVLEQDLGTALEVSDQLPAHSVWLARELLDKVEEGRC